MSTQWLDVDYDDNVILCQLCNKYSQSNGNIATMHVCKHAFHISCLIDYEQERCNMSCPCCHEPYADIRLSLTVSFQKQDIDLFISNLTDYAN